MLNVIWRGHRRKLLGKWNLALEIQGSLELDVLLALESGSGPQKDLALFPFPFFFFSFCNSRKGIFCLVAEFNVSSQLGIASRDLPECNISISKLTVLTLKIIQTFCVFILTF